MSIVAKYKFDGSVYADLIPEFNAEFTDYTVTDEVDSENSNHIIRTIESDSLPTLMRFGHPWTNSEEEQIHTSRCNSLLEILDMNTSNIRNMSAMFRICNNLTKINCDWVFHADVTSIGAMFQNCFRLTTLDVSNWDTSNITIMGSMFNNCNNLTSLDLSNWDTSNVTNMRSMFSGCKNLTSLDVSNFDTSNVTDISTMFGDTLLLTDIGMIYCDKSTINKVASLLPTDHNITIWVESDDILQYDQYDHITYKTQKVQDTVHLNSPLLIGDTIEVIDGKTYHVHRYGKVVLDGSKSFNISVTEPEYVRFFSSLKHLGISNAKGNASLLCNNFINVPYITLEQRLCEGIGIKKDAVDLGINILKYRLSELTANGFKQWLQENPTTVIYELKEPYYELISEEPLELTLLDTTDNAVNNNSILPSNMTIANKELSTIAIKPSTIYTLAFDKSIEDSEVTIDICGGEQITTVLNRIELTTPSELGSGIRFISSDGCIISNVRLLEGSLVESAIPKETFEGLQSSFDDGYIIGENLLGSSPYEQTLDLRILYKLTNEDSNLYTIYNGTNKIIYFDTSYKETGNYATSLMINPESIRRITLADNLKFRFINAHVNEGWKCTDDDVEYINNNVVILKGDHTHLSEAELMRYIEKGTSHYEEEDYNHVGKYKVQYKVTGKNKFNLASKLKHIANNSSMITHINPSSILVNGIGDVTIVSSIGLSSLLKEGVTYTMSVKGFDNVHCGIGYDNVHSTSKITTFTYDGKQNIFIWFQGVQGTEYNTTITFQLEEGTTPTEYEPYKEDIKTYYLSSPLLEGDTIEDVNGVATHVKRYEKVVLDGSEQYNENSNNTILYSITISSNCKRPISNSVTDFVPFKCDKRVPVAADSIYLGLIGNSIAISKDGLIGLSLDGKTKSEILNDLKNNTVTVVYELVSPIYEPISDEPILLDLYTNGHLDLSNENIPIQKTEFRNFTKELAYLQPSTDYVVKFSSDNIGTARVYLDSSVKEINVVKGINEVIITTPSTIVNNNIIIDGIGFNISDVQVVANAIKDGDIKDFDYFKGLQSSFESELVTDETDENYGKYKVECKIVGKNKFDMDNIVPHYHVSSISEGVITSIEYSKDYGWVRIRLLETYKLKAGTYYLQFKMRSDDYTKGINYVRLEKTIDKDVLLHSRRLVNPNCNSDYQTYELEFVVEKDFDVNYLFIQGSITTSTSLQIKDLMLSEIQATPYEPYKESIHTLYLNSPLLKGDKLVIHEGKLCHYHKMGMVVLDGSEGWTGNYSFTDRGRYSTPLITGSSNLICDKFSVHNGESSEGIYTNSSNTSLLLTLSHSKDTPKQWLQQNPTTVVYQLAEPYYEPIEPQLSQYSFSTVKDGDMEIITVLPIEKVNLTYRTDINGVSSIEEQIASIQESTDISSIIDEEVDE